MVKKSKNKEVIIDADKILRAYTRLKGIKNNLPEEELIPWYHIRDYHEIIDSLEKETSFTLPEFRIPETEIKTFGKIEGCVNSFFISKLDALLSYFEIKFLSTKELEIGFKPPNKEKEQ